MAIHLTRPGPQRGGGVAGGHDPVTAGRILGWLYVLSGLMAVPMAVLPNRPDFHTVAMGVLGAVCVALGVAAIRAPWQRWPSLVIWMSVVATFVLAAVGNLLNGGDPYRQLLFYPLIFTWVGLFHPPGTSLRLAPVAALAYLAPLVVSGADAPAKVTVLYAVPILVAVGEVLSWRTQRLSQVRAELSHQAHHDALTGLPNRRQLLEVLTWGLRDADGAGREVGLLVVDLDGFKLVNDTFGHAAGDEVLIEVGEMLRSMVRAGDVVGRLGGDEFAIVVRNANELQIVADRIENRIDTFSREAAVPLSSSIGAVRSRPGDTADALLRRGDAVMYEAKRRRRDLRVAAQGDAGPVRPLRRDGYETTAAELRRAIADGEMVVHYQPIVSLSNGGVSKVEAVVRWNHPVAGLLPPSRFIADAEANGAIIDIGAEVLRQAASQVVAWRGGPHPRLELTVNLSPRELSDRSLPDRVAATLDEAGLDRHAAWFEVTESVIVDPTSVPVLDRLVQLGVRLAIDDFGTGYANLTNLRQIRVGAIKIDRSFVAGLGRNPGDTAIVRNTVNLARELGLVVVGEGVETDAQAEALRAAGCQFAQGYLLSPPRDPRQTALWVGHDGDLPGAHDGTEQRRLSALAATGIIGTEPEAVYLTIVEAAAAAFDVPFALVSFVEADRVWHKARVGVESTATPRRWALASPVVAEPGGLLVIGDAACDARFARHPLVVGDTGVRFFAGAAITAPGGEPIGAVVVADRRPRTPTSVQLSLLRHLADLAGEQLSIRAARVELEVLRHQQVRHEHLRTTRQHLLQTLVDNSRDLIVLLDLDGTILYVNPVAAYYGHDARQWVGRSAFDLLHPGDTADAMAALAGATSNPSPGTPIALRLRTGDGRWARVQATGTAYEDDDGRRLVVVARGSIDDAQPSSNPALPQSQPAGSERRHAAVPSSSTPTPVASREAV